MSEISVKDKDRKKAEIFLETYLSERIPDADFSKGSALRDHTIGAIAHIYALLKEEVANVRNATSLRKVTDIEDEREFEEAVDNLVGTWFLQRKQGRKVRGVITLHFSRPHDGHIPVGTRFTKRPGISFVMEGSSTFVYSASQLTPVIGTDGAVVSYTLRLPVVAENVGTSYEIDAGSFSYTPSISPYLQSVNNEEPFTGARDPETPEELLDRAPDSLTKRDLSTRKSIKAILQDEFPTIKRMVVQGMGDEAMKRDILEIPESYMQLHTGGCVDIYVSTPISSRRVFEAEVGAPFVDPRRGVYLFRDDTVDDWRRFVAPGDILHIRNAEAREVDRYKITKVTRHYLEVHERQPFPSERPVVLRNGVVFSGVQILDERTIRCVNAQFSRQDIGSYVEISGSSEGNDGLHQIKDVLLQNHSVEIRTNDLVPEDTSRLQLRMIKDAVVYSIGDVGPSFDNKVSRRLTGEFTKLFQEDGVVLLPSHPVHRIEEVTVLDPLSPDADALTGRVFFQNRVNTAPSAKSGAREYQVYSDQPLVTNSAEQMVHLRVRTQNLKEGAMAALMPAGDGGGVFQTPKEQFVPEDLHKTIFIANASYPENRGDFLISEVVDEYTVTLTRPDNPELEVKPEARLKWFIHEDQKYNGKTLRVVYDSVESFDSISEFVRTRDNRNPCADALVKAFTSIYVSFDLHYKTRPDAEVFLEPEAAVASLVEFINEFPETSTLSVSDIVSFFYAENQQTISHVQLPLKVFYTLFAPDGRAIHYETHDELVIDPSCQTGNVPEDLLPNPLELGITKDTVRYITNDSLIRLVRVDT